jgi:hypothetical protein
MVASGGVVRRKRREENPTPSLPIRGGWKREKGKKIMKNWILHFVQNDNCMIL